MKTFKLLLTLCAVLALSACTKMVDVKKTEIAFSIDGKSNEWRPTVYSGNAILLDAWWCRKTCDDAHIFEAPLVVKTVKAKYAKYAMPKSSDLDLELDIAIKFTLNRTGSTQEILNRFKAASTLYPYTTLGQVRGENQIFRTSINSIINIEFNDAAVKSKLRPVLSPFTLEDAYANINSGGSIVSDIRKEIESLAEQSSGLIKVLDVQILRIAQPTEIIAEKNKIQKALAKDQTEANLLKIHERRLAQRHRISIKEQINNLELFELSASAMTNQAIAYRWTMVAEQFAQAGLPFAIDPAMLNPSFTQTKATGENIDEVIGKLKAKLEKLESECSPNCEN